MGSCLSIAGASSLPSMDECDEPLWSPTLLSDYRIEMRVHRVPGRLFLNGSSQIASLYCKQGSGEINQDAMLVWDNFCSEDGTVFCGVFDGHGPYGHLVAKKLRDSFPLKLMAQWNSPNPYSYRTFYTTSMNDFKPDTIAPTEIPTLRQSFIRACKVMDRELRLHNQIDCSSSGSTAVTLLKQDLLIANVGDSRAVLATQDRNGSLVAIQLTTDLKPDLPREAERIRICKGRVFALKNEPGIYRVWLPNVNSPGLAMSRSFGDFCLKNFGLISVPDFSYHRLTHRDQFVVLATDGVTAGGRNTVEVILQQQELPHLSHLGVRAWRGSLSSKYPINNFEV